MVAESRPNLPVSDRRAYRRGQILGLTIAEFFLVLSFLLLLLLGFWITEYERETALLQELKAKIEERGLDFTVEKFLSEIANLHQLQDDLRLAKERESSLVKRADAAEAKVATIETRLKELELKNKKLNDETAKARDLLDFTKNMSQQDVKDFI